MTWIWYASAVVLVGIGICSEYYDKGLVKVFTKGRSKGFKEGWLAGIDYERQRTAKEDKI